MRATTIFLLFAIALTVLGGCTGWYSRYFERTENSLQCTGEFCFHPRIVSYKDEFGEPDALNEHGFWISVKVYDTSIVQPKDIREGDQVANRRGLADIFKDRLVKLIRFDSLTLLLTPQDTTIMVRPDTSRYTPRDIDYLSYHFGKVTIPEATTGLSAAFHYRMLDDSPLHPSIDSVVFDLVRVEEKAAVPVLQKLVRPTEEPEEDSLTKEVQETDD
ncbi:MAG: hypothetical protein GY854_24810 [Deltaproteobacteria bacterium]|nr:hypothetical protein [Deltaproteobacteria bacterium]